MSGAFGWVRHNGPVSSGSNAQPSGGYQNARQKYRSAGDLQDTPVDLGSGKGRNLNAFAKRTNVVSSAVPDGKGRVTATAANVLIVAIDGTGSMGTWPQEIFRRLPLLYHKATEYLGTDDLEILFIAHGDARATDPRPVQVGKIGRGPELDQVIASFDMGGFHGGGQGRESHELIMYYLLNRLDLKEAQNVFCFFLTDEAAWDEVRDEDVRRLLGGELPKGDVSTRLVAEALKYKMHLYSVLCETNSYDPDPIRRWWQQLFGGEHVLPLSDARRVVDVMLGTMAAMVGKRDRFEDDLKTRLLPTPHGQENVVTVLTAIDMVGKGSPSNPFRKGSGTGTKSLL